MNKILRGQDATTYHQQKINEIIIKNNRRRSVTFCDYFSDSFGDPFPCVMGVVCGGERESFKLFFTYFLREKIRRFEYQ